MCREDNPYKASAGAELDAQIQQAYFREMELHQWAFSTDRKSADFLKKNLEAKFKSKVVVGRTSRLKGFFARLDSDPSTSTETLAETYELAIARLANVLGTRLSRLG
jgi:hypothetical protein